jgi:pimeloyl-ACP methyl ester carboxylesterase
MANRVWVVMVSLLAAGCTSVATRDAPFSLAELKALPQLAIIDPKYFRTTDGTRLAYYDYKTSEFSKRALIFVHGGGACSSLGYQYLAKTLSEEYETRVYLFDMRGHGLSEGNRGDAPTKERVWQDISEFIRYVRSDRNTGEIFLGGHSSGGGLVLNYATWRRRESVSGYVFISPKLGYRSNADRFNILDDPFAKTNVLVVLLNQISCGLLNAHATAVNLCFGSELQKTEPLLVDKYTCTVVNAITPENPKVQFSKLDKPFCLFIGGNDELLSPERTINYLSYTKKNVKEKSYASIVSSQTHLGILRVVGEMIGHYLVREIRDF